MRKSHPGVVIEPAVQEYCVKPQYDADGVQVSAGIRRDGKEEGDPVPLEPPLSYQKPPDVMVLIKRMMENERLMAKLDAEGFDTPEEADDFAIEDDPLDPLTPYEKHFEPPPVSASTGDDSGAGKRAPQDAASPAAVNNSLASRGQESEPQSDGSSRRTKEARKRSASDDRQQERSRSKDTRGEDHSEDSED